jgi:hypothetical protein
VHQSPPQKSAKLFRWVLISVFADLDWRSGMAGRAVFLIVVALAAVFPIEPMQSAVRDCADFVDSSAGGRTENEAKASALAGWMKKVEELGMERVRWQTAADRSLQCRLADGSYSCTARVRPCIIKQVAPDDWRPQHPSAHRP